MSIVQTGLTYATLLVHISWIAGLLLYLVYRSPLQTESFDAYIRGIVDFLSNYYRETSLVMVSVATSGSLYFSEILGWEPCIMCWYQRILMYPLVILFGVAVILFKDDVEDYALPILTLGTGVSLYHYLVQMLDTIQSSCTATGISCDAVFTQGLDYITIPMMALTVFITVLILNWKFSNQS